LLYLRSSAASLLTDYLHADDLVTTHDAIYDFHVRFVHMPEDSVAAVEVRLSPGPRSVEMSRDAKRGSAGFKYSNNPVLTMVSLSYFYT
jgi:hypothetical protein